MDDIKQTQGPVVGFVMNKEAMSNTSRVCKGRPSVKVDFAVLLRLREGDRLGWCRVAQEYQKKTGQFISRDTVKRRYLRYKALESEGRVINVGSFSVQKYYKPQPIVKSGVIITSVPNSGK